MVEERTLGNKIFDVFNHVLLVFLSIACLLPMVHMLAVSLSSSAASLGNLVKLWPVDFTTYNYVRIINNGQFQRSLTISVLRVLLGTTINLLIISITAYPIAIQEEFWGKQFFKWLLIFAMLFSGGLIPTYLAIRSLGLLDKIWVLVLPGAVATWSIILMTNFYRRLPIEISEAATIDGASHWQILFRIYLPLSVPVLATLTLFSAVGHWNSWFDGLIYMKTPDKYPLQTYLQTTIIARDFSNLLTVDKETIERLSERSLRAAQIFLATIPILLVYPFLQRYFVTGLTLGSVKG